MSKPYLKLIVFMFLFSSSVAHPAEEIVLAGQHFTKLAVYEAIWPKFKIVSEKGSEFKSSVGSIGEGNKVLSNVEIVAAKFLPQHLLVLAEVLKDDCRKDGKNADEDGNRVNFRNYSRFFYALKNVAGKLKVIDHVSFSSPEESANQDGEVAYACDEFFYSSTANLDLAPYKINNKERAFGYRISNLSNHANENSEITDLILYRLESDQLSKVLEWRVRDTSRVDDSSITNKTAIISVDKEMVNKAFVWNIKENDKKKKKSIRLVWDGKSYAADEKSHSK